MYTSTSSIEAEWRLCAKTLPRSRSTKLARVQDVDFVQSSATGSRMQLTTSRLEFIYAFEKLLDFRSLNAVKWNCGSIFVRYSH